MVALDTWAGMTGVCVGVVVQLCSFRGHHPLTTVGVPLLANSMWCFAGVAGYYLWERVKKEEEETCVRKSMGV